MLVDTPHGFECLIITVEGSLFSESNISKELDTIQNKFLKKVESGSYPFFRLGKVGVSLVLRSTSIKQINLCKNVINKTLKKKKIKLFKNS